MKRFLVLFVAVFLGLANLTPVSAGTLDEGRAPSNLRATRTEPRVIVLTWDQIPLAAEYQVERRLDEVGATRVTQTVDGVWFVDNNSPGQPTTTVPGGSYNYRVRGIGTDGSVSPWSEAILVLTPQKLAPQAPGLTANAVGERAVEVLVTGPTGATVSIIRGDGTTLVSRQSLPETGGALTVVDRLVSPGTEVSYEASFEQGAGEQRPRKSSVSVAIPGTPVSGPTGFRTTRQDPGQVVLNWNPVPGASEYRVTRSNGPGTSRTLISNSVWFVFPGLTESTTYSFAVAAITAQGLTAPSLLEVTTARRVLAPVDPVLFGASETSVSINYEAHPSVPSFLVERDGVVTLSTIGRPSQDRLLTPGTTYSYTVREVGADGRIGPLGPTLQVTTPGVAPGEALGPPSVIATYARSRRIVLRIEETDRAVQYEIERDGVLIDTIPRNRNRGYPFTWFTDFERTVGTEYTYTVRTVNQLGERSAPSNPVVVIAGGALVSD